MLQRIFAPNYTFGHMKYYHARLKIQSVIQLTVTWWCLFQTPDVLKYHIVNQYLTEETIRNGEEFPSLLGNGRDYLVKITNPRKGMVCVKLFLKFSSCIRSHHSSHPYVVKFQPFFCVKKRTRLRLLMNIFLKPLVNPNV